MTDHITVTLILHVCVALLSFCRNSETTAHYQAATVVVVHYTITKMVAVSGVRTHTATALASTTRCDELRVDDEIVSRD
jgi:hypothetical protein